MSKEVKKYGIILGAYVELRGIGIMMNQNKIQYKTKKDYTNYFITVFVLLIITILIVSQNEAKDQDEILLNDFSHYQEINTLFEQGNTEYVVDPLEELNKIYNDDYNIAYGLGYAYLNNGRNDAALIMYTRSLDLNPYLVENKDFMYQYALVLSNNKQFDNAIIVIDRLLSLPIDEPFKITINELRDSINEMKGSTT